MPDGKQCSPPTRRENHVGCGVAAVLSTAEWVRAVPSVEAVMENDAAYHIPGLLLAFVLYRVAQAARCSFGKSAEAIRASTANGQPNACRLRCAAGPADSSSFPLANIAETAGSGLRAAI